MMMDLLEGRMMETEKEPVGSSCYSVDTRPVTADTEGDADGNFDEDVEVTPHGTLQRLVKEDLKFSKDILSEDKDVDDGQQPLGIVESCFPYFARRNPLAQHRPHHSPHSNSKIPVAAGFCPGVKCYFGGDGCDEDVAFEPGNPPHSSKQLSSQVLGAAGDRPPTDHAEEIPLKSVG